MKTYTICVPYDQFKEYMLNNNIYDEYVDDDVIEIEYRYEDDPHKICLVWNVSDVDKKHKTRYNGSSYFAMWWCGMMADEDSDDDNNDDE
jgi:hypothetical protein